MDWNDFFERTRVSAKVESYSKLAPLLGITDGAIGHYRMGRRVPQVWVVADALRIQGHPEPEKQAIEIMKRAALTSPERTFWKRLAATAMTLALGVGLAAPRDVQAAVRANITPTVYTLCEMAYWVHQTWPARSSLILRLHPSDLPVCLSAADKLRLSLWPVAACIGPGQELHETVRQGPTNGERF